MRISADVERRVLNRQKDHKLNVKILNMVSRHLRELNGNGTFFQNLRGFSKPRQA